MPSTANLSSTHPCIAYFVVRYPTLSQTFIQREIAGLCQHGFEITVFTCSQWGNPFTWQAAKDLGCVSCRVEPMRLRKLTAALWQALLLLVSRPRLVLQAFRLIPSYRWAGPENFLANIWGVIVGLSQADTLRRFHFQAAHGAWATLPATAAGIASAIAKIPFSFGAHAYDLYRHGGDGFLQEKMAAAAWIHTTTQAGVDHLTQLAPFSRNKMVLARRGLLSLPELKTDHWNAAEIHMLSIGRLVPKKGQMHQLCACRWLMDQGLQFKLRIIGDGPLRQQLENEKKLLHLKEAVEFVGALNPEDVVRQYAWADLLWHAGITDAEGDRDGLPNVIGEAMAHGVIVLTSPQTGPLEAIEHEVTGMIADAQKPETILQMIQRLTDNPQLRTRIRTSAHHWVETHFMASKNTARLAQAFQRNCASSF